MEVTKSQRIQQLEAEVADLKRQLESARDLAAKEVEPQDDDPNVVQDDDDDDEED